MDLPFLIASFIHSWKVNLGCFHPIHISRSSQCLLSFILPPSVAFHWPIIIWMKPHILELVSLRVEGLVVSAHLPCPTFPVTPKVSSSSLLRAVIHRLCRALGTC